MATHYPVIVVGGGTMGTATAWALGRRGIPALVLEQFGHIHGFGSHSGHTRVIRHAYAEGAHYVPLVLRADALWEELEAESGQKLLHRSGVLDLAKPGFAHFPGAARAAAEEHGLPYEWLDGEEIRRRWPAWNAPDDWQGLFESRSGFLVVEPALRAMAESARRAGGEVREHEPVQAWRVDGDGVTVSTADGEYHADRLVVTAGSWAGRLLAELGLPLTVLRKVLWWLEVEQPTLFEPERFPVFSIASASSNVYGLPIFGRPGMKTAEHIGGQAGDPDSVYRTVSDREITEVVPVAQEAFHGVTGKALDQVVCLYTMTPDEDFVIDRHPTLPQVIFAAGFSGHGFKFAPAIGEHLVALALDGVSPYPRFSASRFGGVAV